MKLDADTRAQLLLDMTLDYDPAGSTVEVDVDGTWYAATWQGAAVEANDRWTQTAKTTSYFAGPDAVASGAVVLELGTYQTQTRVTTGSGAAATIIARNAEAIRVA